MRKHFFNYLSKLARYDKNIIFLTGDLGYGYFEEFRDRFPRQFINCGCIEQTMLGIAAGLARSGKKPYVYSTIPFLIMRAYEQVRSDICYQNLNVKMFGVSMSGFLGFSHNLQNGEFEEYLLGILPNLNTYYPISQIEIEKDMLKEYKRNGPAYIRI